MDTDTLKSAFGIHEANGYASDWLLNEFGGTCASQGKFLRYKDYLNIPGPGTGHDGDSNVSIELDRSIQTAARDLMREVEAS
jgi:hypothetical protein